MQTDENDSNHHTTSYKNSKEPPRKNKLPVTVVLGDLIMKGLKSSDKKNKVVVKYLSGAKTNIQSYIIPNLEKNSETIIVQTGTND